MVLPGVQPHSAGQGRQRERVYRRSSQIIEGSSLDYRLDAMGTIVEGELIRCCRAAAVRRGSRDGLRADQLQVEARSSGGHSGRLVSKVASVESKLGHCSRRVDRSNPRVFITGKSPRECCIHGSGGCRDCRRRNCRPRHGVAIDRTGIRTARARAGKGSSVGEHQTGQIQASSLGIYYKPGTLKAINCRTGKAAMERFCRAGVRYEICGKVIVAVSSSELPHLMKTSTAASRTA